MNKKNNNIKLVALEGINTEWFDIYMDISGNKEYLMSHRRNNVIFNYLKQGIKITDYNRDIQRFITLLASSKCRFNKGTASAKRKRYKNQMRKLQNSLEHIFTVANDYTYEAESAQVLRVV